MTFMRRSEVSHRSREWVTLPRMELHDLRCFVAVAEEGSITGAADRLHMTQPPLSVRMRQLERELGVGLLERHGRGVEPTAAGRALLERARRLLADGEATVAAVRSVGHGVRGELTISIGSAVAPSLLAGLGRGLLAGAPDLELTVRDSPAERVLEEVRHGDAHAGLLHLPAPEPGGPRLLLESAVVVREPVVAVLPADHAAVSDELVDLRELIGAPLVVLGREAALGLHDRVIGAWAAAGGAPGDVLEAGTVPTALALVEAGVGPALLPLTLARAAPPDVVVALLRRHVPAVETAVVWRPGDRIPVLARFLRLALATPEPDALGPAHARAASGPPR